MSVPRGFENRYVLVETCEGLRSGEDKGAEDRALNFNNGTTPAIGVRQSSNANEGTINGSGTMIAPHVKFETHSIRAPRTLPNVVFGDVIDSTWDIETVSLLAAYSLYVILYRGVLLFIVQSGGPIITVLVLTFVDRVI